MREFLVEGDNNVLWYQTLRLFNEGLKKKELNRNQGIGLDEQSQREAGKDYSELELKAVGGDEGEHPIWEQSLLGQIKKVKLAIGITMYNEDWSEFTRTIKGVVQGIADMYNDHKAVMGEDAETWDQFKEQFIIILLADGYQNINKEFKTNAEKGNFFKEEAITDTFTKLGENGKPP